MSSELKVLADRYALESTIASGGMATVWRARDEVLARTVAVKILHAHLADDEQFLERFRREALAAARLTHPHIVAIYDTGREPDPDGHERHYIVMEHCAGGTLQEKLEEGGPMPPARVVAIAAEICDALGYAHRAGIVHRDIKPANVLITSDGTLKVADFGIAKAALDAQDITTTGSILGTVSYLSPEQVRGEEPRAASDLYALGVLVYELLVGRPPFTAESQLATAMKHLKEPVAPLRSQRAGVPRALDAAVLKALSKAPEERYGSAEEMRAALLAATVGDQTAAFPVARRATTPARGLGAAGGAGEEEPLDAAATRSEPWRLVPILLLVALAVVVALLLPSLFGAGEPGGLRRQAPGGRGGGAPSTVEVAAASDFDPEGDGSEHSEEVSLAYDGDPGTAWTTEGYQDPLGTFKSGVGLVFDLGESIEVGEVVVDGCRGCALELRAGDQQNGAAGDYQLVDQADAAGSPQTFEGGSGRYWVVWITGFPGGGAGRGAISEVEFRGS